MDYYQVNAVAALLTTMIAVGRGECLHDPCVLPAESSLRFALLGDTGGLPIYPYYSRAQTKVAEALQTVRDAKRIQFNVNVGDNFYFNGVDDENDKRFDVGDETK